MSKTKATLRALTRVSLNTCPAGPDTLWVQGMGCGLPHGTVCVVLSDGEPFLREWHPVGPNDGNWWPLKGQRGEMIREHEVTAYVVTGRPKGYEAAEDSD